MCICGKTFSLRTPAFLPFKRQPRKMVKHTQTIRRQFAGGWGLALRGLTVFNLVFYNHENPFSQSNFFILKAASYSKK